MVVSQVKEPLELPALRDVNHIKMFDWSSGPVAAVQSAVLDGFCQVENCEPFGAFEVCDGAGHFKGAEKALCDESGTRVENSGDGVNLGGFEEFFEGEVICVGGME